MDAVNEELDIIAGPQGSFSLQRDHRDYRCGIIADTSKWRKKKNQSAQFLFDEVVVVFHSWVRTFGTY